MINSQYLFCPSHESCDYAEFQTFHGEHHDIKIYGLPSDAVCLLDIRNAEHNSEGLRFKEIRINNMNVSLFKKGTNREASYFYGHEQLSDTSDNERDWDFASFFGVEYRERARLIIRPLGSGTTSFKSSLTSLYPYEPYHYDYGLSTGAILIIVFGSLSLVLLVAILVVCIIKTVRARRFLKKRAEDVYVNVPEEVPSPKENSMLEINLPKQTDCVRENNAINDSVETLNSEQLEYNPNLSSDRESLIDK